MEYTAVEGVVVEGRRLGRTLGFPTANIELDESVELRGGVYRSRVEVGGVWYDAVTNIGVNPTVGVVSRRLESHILELDADIYGEWIRVELVERLRGEMQFESVDALREQVLSDIEECRVRIASLRRVIETS